MQSWSQVTLTADADLTARHSGITSLSDDANWTEKHPIAKRRLEHRLRRLLTPYVSSLPKAQYSDGAYTSGANTFTSASGNFQAKDVNVQVEDYLEILSNVNDLGTYRVASVASSTGLTVKNADATAFTFSETQTGVQYRIRLDPLDKIIDPVNTLKDAALELVMYLVYDDLSKGRPESDFFAQRRDAIINPENGSGTFRVEFRAALGDLQVDLGTDGVAAPFERMQNYGSVNLVRTGSGGGRPLDDITDSLRSFLNR